MFQKRGYFAFGSGVMSEETFMELVLELGAEDFAADSNQYEIFTSMEDYVQVRETAEYAGTRSLSAFFPKSTP